MLRLQQSFIYGCVFFVPIDSGSYWPVAARASGRERPARRKGESRPNRQHGTLAPGWWHSTVLSRAFSLIRVVVIAVIQGDRGDKGVAGFKGERVSNVIVQSNLRFMST